MELPLNTKHPHRASLKTLTPLAKLLTIKAPTLSAISPDSKRGSLKDSLPIFRTDSDLLAIGTTQTQVTEPEQPDVQNAKSVDPPILRKKFSGPSFLLRQKTTLLSPKNLSVQESEVLTKSSRKSTNSSQTKTAQEIDSQMTTKNIASPKLKPKKKSVLDSSGSSFYTDKLSKSRLLRQKDQQTDILPLADQSFNGGDNNDKLPLSSVMRRRSCHCSDCGGISTFEKKHMNIAILCKRGQEKKNAAFLSLRYSGDWSAMLGPRPSIDITPITVGKRNSHDYSPYSPMLNSPTSSFSSSKKFLSVAFSWDKAPSHLSKFAGNKRSNTIQMEKVARKESQSKFDSNFCVEDDAEEEDVEGPVILLKSLGRKALSKNMVNSKSSIDNEADERRKASRQGLRNHGVTASSFESSEDSPTEYAPMSKTQTEFMKKLPGYKMSREQRTKELANLLGKTPKKMHYSPSKTDEWGKKDGKVSYKIPKKLKKMNTTAKIKNTVILDTYINSVPSINVGKHTRLNSSNTLRFKEPLSAIAYKHSSWYSMSSPHSPHKPVSSQYDMVDQGGTLDDITGQRPMTTYAIEEKVKVRKRAQKESTIFESVKLKNARDVLEELKQKRKNFRMIVKGEGGGATEGKSIKTIGKKSTKKASSRKEILTSLLKPEELRKTYQSQRSLIFSTRSVKEN